MCKPGTLCANSPRMLPHVALPPRKEYFEYPSSALTSVCWLTTSGLREAVVFGLITSGMPVIMVNTERAVGTVGTKKFVKRIPSLAIASNAGLATHQPGIPGDEQQHPQNARQYGIGLPRHSSRHRHRRQMIGEARVQPLAYIAVVPEIDEVEEQHDALRGREIAEPGDPRGAPARRIENRDPAEERERQTEEQREPQVELEPQVEGLEDVRPGRARRGLVKRRPKDDSKSREHGDIDRGHREQKANERREPAEHLCETKRPAAPSQSATRTAESLP